MKHYIKNKSRLWKSFGLIHTVRFCLFVRNEQNEIEHKIKNTNLSYCYKKVQYSLQVFILYDIS